MIIKVFTNSGVGVDLFRFGLNTEEATAHDYLNFIENVVGFCEKDKVTLEKDANLRGKTLNHKFLKSVGSVLTRNLSPEFIDE